MTTGDESEREIPRPLKLWRLVRMLDFPALFLGGGAAALGHRWGGFVLVANVAIQIGAKVVVGHWAYRDVMARPWPHVAALEEDEWDD